MSSFIVTAGVIIMMATLSYFYGAYFMKISNCTIFFLSLMNGVSQSIIVNCLVGHRLYSISFLLSVSTVVYVIANDHFQNCNDFQSSFLGKFCQSPLPVNQCGFFL